ncbi:hypothetical protein ACG3SL_02455 [Sphingomonas sp. CJ20]
MAPPNLKDPADAEAYRTELAGVGRGIRLAGVLIATLGAILVLLHRKGWVPVPIWLGVIVLGAGVMLMITAVAARSRYHQLRMRG